jgi:hypothetical protein
MPKIRKSNQLREQTLTLLSIEREQTNERHIECEGKKGPTSQQGEDSKQPLQAKGTVKRSH